MIRITSFSPGSQVPSATLNSMQDESMSGAPMTDAGASNLLNKSPTIMGQGIDSRFYLCNAAIADTHVQTIDDSQDWHDRIVLAVTYQDLGDGAGNPGATDDAIWGAEILGSPGTLVSGKWGFLGKGAQKSGGGQVTTANKPVPAFGTSWAMRIVATSNGLWLYVDSFDSNKLKVYNGTGGSITMAGFWVVWTTKTGGRT